MTISQKLHDLLDDWLSGGGVPVLVTPVGSDTYVPTVTEITLTVVFDETSAVEQNASVATLTERTRLNSIWLDMSNATQDITIRLYHKIDGTNYRLFQENTWLSTDDPGVLIDGFTAYRDIKITLQCGGGGAGNVNIPLVVV